MTSSETRPLYHRVSHTLIIIALLTYGIFIGQEIIVPLALATLLAILLRPVEAWLMRIGFHKVMAISLALILAIIVLSGIAFFILMQISNFTDDWPKLQDNINDFYQDARRWIRSQYNVSYRQQNQYIKQAQQKTIESLQGNGAGAIAALSGPLGTLALLPIYVFLLLYYRTMLLKFIVSLFAEKHSERVWEIIGQTKTVIQSYVVGLLLETACVALLNSLGLIALGVKYAFLLGALGAILNLIPYIGGLIAIVLTVLVAFMNNPDPSVLLGVVIVYLVVQFIDNNFFVPVIIGSKVKVNALVSIIGVLIGGALAGVSGMFLSIPAIALLKVIFDRVEGLEAWGVLIGDDTPEDSRRIRFPKWLRFWERS
ncbi:MAG: AI-2E family transporter [Siphonobacter sp.]